MGAIRCVASYARARLRPSKNPRSLEDWVRNQFGWRLFSIFFKTYTEKVWGIRTKELSADWAAQRIKSLDLWLVVKSALLPGRKAKSRGEIVTTLIDRFRYPRLGPGQMWEKVTSILASRGRPVLMGRTILRIEHRDGRVRTVVARNQDGAQEEHAGSQFVSSIPMRELIHLLEPAPPAAVLEAANKPGSPGFISTALMLKQPDVCPHDSHYRHHPAVKAG